jgi:hypothetical protein
MLDNLNKKALGERDIYTKCILPTLKRVGWNEMLQIREKVYFTNVVDVPAASRAAAAG